MFTGYAQICVARPFDFHTRLTGEFDYCLVTAFNAIEIVRAVVAQLIIASELPVPSNEFLTTEGVT